MTSPETQAELVELLRTMRETLDRVLDLVMAERTEDD